MKSETKWVYSLMRRDDAKKRIEKLKKVIDKHRYLYHVLDQEEISEEALDSLKKELFDLEQKYPEFITPDSPSQRVGGAPLKEFKKVRRGKPMLSLNDAFSEGDIKDWIERIDKIIPGEKEFFCEYKIDGLAFEVIYDKGLFKIGSTRGDGTVGEDVSQNLKTVSSIPLKIDGKSNVDGKYRELTKGFLNRKISIRGEIFISKKEFKKINRKREEDGLSSFANPRNVAAGSIRQLDPSVAASRNLDSFAYDLITENDPKTHSEKHHLLKSLGFKINPYSKICKTPEEIFDFYQDCKNRRKNLPYEIDGIVVMVNDNKLFELLGVAGKAPRGAIAYKFELKQATTTIEKIDVQVGRTGVLTPVAELRPVSLAGVTISRATLHNYDEIEEMRMMIGDTVIVGRAGDVIPDIIEVLPELRTGDEKKIKIPSVCPSCKEPLIYEKKGSFIIRCINRNCPERKRRLFEHFVSRKAFNISGVGKKAVEKLIETDRVSDPADLFFLEKDDFLKLEGFADKMAQNAIDSIEKSKTVAGQKLIFSLGIEGVGEETALLLVKNFKDIDEVAQASEVDLINIKDIGEITAKKIYDWFRDQKNKDFLDKIKAANIKIQYPKQFGKLDNRKFVLTGSLLSLKREEVKQRIRLLGGDVSETVSSNVDYIVVGDNPGSKLKKARDLRIKEIRENDLIKMMEDD